VQALGGQVQDAAGGALEDESHRGSYWTRPEPWQLVQGPVKVSVRGSCVPSGLVMTPCRICWVTPAPPQAEQVIGWFGLDM
jgi:hypothetical protein